MAEYIPYNQQVPLDDSNGLSPILFKNFRFDAKNGFRARDLIDYYKAQYCEYIHLHSFIDYSKRSPLPTNFGFLIDLIGTTIKCNYCRESQQYDNLLKKWNEILNAGNNHFELKESIFEVFEIIGHMSINIIYVIPNFNFIADSLDIREVDVLHNVAVENNYVKIWLITEKLSDKFYQESVNLKFIQSFKYDKNFKHNIMNKLKVFISYNHNDKDFARKIKSKLEEADLEVIIDEEAMKSGQQIEDFIKRSIAESGITLSIVSENSLQSAWVAKETIYSKVENELSGRNFMPCKIDDSIFDLKFPDRAMDKIDEKLNEIDTTLKGRIDCKRGIEDLTDERTRYTRLRNELPSIIGYFKGANCTDLQEISFEKGMRKVISDIKDCGRKEIENYQSPSNAHTTINQSGSNNFNLGNNYGVINYNGK